MTNRDIEVVILSDDEIKVSKLKSLLSKFYPVNIASVCHCPAEAILYLNNHRATIFFLDLDESEVLQDIRKPPFIVGLCDAVNTKRIKTFLKMGFFEVFYSPYSEVELNCIMGKILNIYGTYNKVDQRIWKRVEEENMAYNAENSNQKAVFIMGKRNEDSMRVVFDNVLYLKKIGNQVCIYFEDGLKKYYRTNLKMLHNRFPKSQFMKINKSVVVNIDKVTGLKKNRVEISGNDIFELSRSFKKSLKERLSK
jgi:DNA-binding LytR/AlgR family response regulator